MDIVLGSPYLNRRYDTPGIAQVGTYTFGGAVDWHITPVFTVAFVGERSVDVTGFGGTGSYIQSKTGVRADYEILRNLILSGRFGYEWDDYIDVARHDQVATSGVGLTYLMNSNVHMSLDYRHVQRQSDVAGAAYGRNIVGGTVRVQY